MHVMCGRRLLATKLAGGLAALAVAFTGTFATGVSAQDASPEASPTPGVIGDAATVECQVADDGYTPVSDEAASSFAIVSEESAARYRAQEELANVGATEAVGETNAIIGTILFGADGAPLACSRFDVDLRTLQSDEARRDNFLYENVLETAEYPLATFVVTEVQGLDGVLTEGEETSVTLIGNLTIHGSTRLVAWEATVTLEGDTITGSATTSFDMPDFDIEEPVVGPVISVEETIQLEVDITAERAA